MIWAAAANIKPQRVADGRQLRRRSDVHMLHARRTRVALKAPVWRRESWSPVQKWHGCVCLPSARIAFTAEASAHAPARASSEEVAPIHPRRARMASSRRAVGRLNEDPPPMHRVGAPWNLVPRFHGSTR
eukprot:4743248-Prymnesium_polylepis.1